MTHASRFLLRFLSLSLMLAALILCSALQCPAQTFGNPDARLVSPPQDYRIKPRDVIDIKIDDAPELSITASVNADGTFLMPYLKRLKAAGKTTDELAQEIADGLRGRYMKDPKVTISIRTFHRLFRVRDYYIVGAIQKPGSYDIEGKATLQQLIALAGGLTEKHGPTAYIIRQPKRAQPKPSDEGDDKAMVIKVDLSGTLTEQLPGDAELQQGDTVSIPETDLVFVVGEVIAPGSFAFAGGTTLRQLVALAQGLTANAKARESEIWRTDPATGARQTFKIDLEAVMKRQVPDVSLMPSDILIVPSTRAGIPGEPRLRLVDPPPRYPVRPLNAPPLHTLPPCKRKEPCITRINIPGGAQV